MEESESDSDEEQYSPKRDDNGKPFYGSNRPSYLDCDDALDRAQGEQNMCVFGRS